jgi:N-acetylglutamate synthase-like GNAT family acetyltransferase
MQKLEISNEDFHISTDKKLLQIDVIHNFLQTTYWANNRSKEKTIKAIENSICFGVYHHKKQIGFARVISDCSTFAYLADVFIVEEYSGKGLSKWLMETILSHPKLQDLRRWILATKDAHGLYAQFGFHAFAFPERWMELPAKNAY